VRYVCGKSVAPNAAFASVGPTDWNDPARPKSKRWIPEGTDIHGWTPFTVAHPACFESVEGSTALAALIKGAQ